MRDTIVLVGPHQTSFAAQNGILEITASGGRVDPHAADLKLDGRTGHLEGFGHGPRALVDAGRQLIINFNNDYLDGVVFGSELSAVGPIAAPNFVTAGGAIAETFHLRPGVEALPGTVLVIAPDGDLIPCEAELDHRVAGVLVGAGGLGTGLLMKPREEGCVAVALAGSAYCDCDASYGAIRAGDLMATSATAGHARRVDAAAAGPGTIIGKALEPLASGRGQIPVLVTPG